MNRINDFLANNLNNLFLFFPIIFGIGIMIYFGLGFEPYIPFSKILLLINVCLIALLLIKKSKISLISYISFVGILLCSCGFLYSYSYTHSIQKTGLEFSVRNADITGVVHSFDYSAEKTKIWIYDTKIERKDNIKPLRVRLGGDFATLPEIGDKVKLKASLFPPADADSPDSFDFAKWAFYNNLDAIGFANSEFEIVSENEDYSFYDSIQKLRTFTHDKIHNLSDYTGKIIDSLVLGYTNAIDDETNQNYKASGISHILSISGFHMAIVSGWLFFIFLFFIKLFPKIIKRIPASKIAIWPALICLFLYLLISGSRVASIRAFTISLIGFIAIFFNRKIFSLRNCMLVFFFLLLVNPHYILEAGFQMSFSAVMALIYFYNKYPIKKPDKNLPFIKRTFLYVWISLKTTFLTAFVAGLATMPFVAYHFRAIPIYGTLGNILTIPFFVIIILPLAFIGTISEICFGFSFPLEIVSYANKIVDSITAWIASLPNAIILTPVIPSLCLFFIALGGLIYMFFKTKIRLVGLGLILLSLSFIFLQDKPILYSTPMSEVIAVKTDSELLRFNKKSSMDNRYVFESWANLNQQNPPKDEMKGSFRKGFDGDNYNMKCENKVCIYNVQNLKIALAIKFIDLYKNIDNLCSLNDLDFIISAFAVRYDKCKAKFLTPEQVGNNAFTLYENKKIRAVKSNRYWSSKYQ